MRFLILFLLVCLSGISAAQSFQKAKPYYILKYDVNATVQGFHKAVIRSPFASDHLSKKPLPANFSKGKVVAIDYYYTQFKSAKSFEQVSLDEARFKNLYLHFPQIHALIDSVPVRFIEQTLAETVAEAKFFFHGFVIYYQIPDPLASARKAEISLLKKLFKNNFELEEVPVYGELKEITGTRPGDFLNVWGKTIHLSEPDTTIVVDQKNIATGIKALGDHSFVTCYQVGAVQSDNQVAVNLFSVPKSYFPGSSPPPFQAGIYGLMEKDREDSRLRYLAKKESAISNELSMDLGESLEKYSADSLVIVIDVTGSMLNSLARVLKWVHQEEVRKRVKGIVLFNDGDGIKLEKKKIGETGGIYFVDDFSKLEEVMINAMEHGGGGDLEENDVEAVIEAREHFGAGHYVLVADNIAPPRDILLLYQIDFVLDLLICHGIEPRQAYLDLLAQTKGQLINRK